MMPKFNDRTVMTIDYPDNVKLTETRFIENKQMMLELETKKACLKIYIERGNIVQITSRPKTKKVKNEVKTH